MSDKQNLSHHGVEEKIFIKKHANSLLEILYNRASCRAFLRKRVSDKVMVDILEASIKSATGGNLQPYSIIRISDSEKRKTLAGLCGQNFIAEAPVNLLFCIDWRRLQRWAALEKAPFSAQRSFRHFWISFQDTIISAQNLCTAADSIGLGTVYIGTIIEHFLKLKKIFKLPKLVFPVILLCLGYPKAKPVPRKKLGIDVIVHDEEYHELDDSTLLNAFGRKYEGQKISASEENIKKFYETCKNVEGEKFADECLKNVKDKGYISPVQRYFGLHYRADEMSRGNEKFMKVIKKFGFNWFEDIHR